MDGHGGEGVRAGGVNPEWNALAVPEDAAPVEDVAVGMGWADEVDCGAALLEFPVPP